MNLQVDIQCASAEPVPEEDDIRRWIAAALSHRDLKGEAEISVRLVDEAEMSSLNRTYRGKSGPTNVLSFPSDLPPELDLPLLGDIVICAPVVRAEAAHQGKHPNAHWAHMLIHGTLHLLGYDHINDEDAHEMEALETAIMASLDYPCPYRSDSIQERATP
jgi:probable rRNA maturation factor